MERGRVEAFSDGVIAIAITLLVLDIKVPPPRAGGMFLANEIARQWPSYAAYVVSFLTIGVIWMNHHATFRRLREVDHTLLLLNLLLLMMIGVLPWSTSLLADYLGSHAGVNSPRPSTEAASWSSQPSSTPCSATSFSVGGSFFMNAWMMRPNDSSIVGAGSACCPIS